MSERRRGRDEDRTAGGRGIAHIELVLASSCNADGVLHPLTSASPANASARVSAS